MSSRHATHLRSPDTARADVEMPASRRHNASRSAAHPVQRLQRLVGNRAVEPLLRYESRHTTDLGARPQTTGILHAAARGIAVTGTALPHAELTRGAVEHHGRDRRLPPSSDGLPTTLLAGIGALTGLDLSDVRVHANSALPARIGALAYACGSDIHLGAGQQHHLPHEAWHVVQQAQGRVTPTFELAPGLPVNNDPALEHEADVMGERAMRAAIGFGFGSYVLGDRACAIGAARSDAAASGEGVVQGNFFWDLLTDPFRLFGYAASAMSAMLAPPAAAPPAALPAGPAAAPPVQLPALDVILDRIRAAETRLMDEAAGLPAGLGAELLAAGTPLFLGNLRAVRANLRQHGLPSMAAHVQAQADAVRLDALANDYSAFCRAVAPDLGEVVLQRDAYAPQLTAADAAAVQVIVQHVVNFSETAAQIKARKTAFVENVLANSVVTNARLLQLATMDKPGAQRLVTAYFDQGRLKIGQFRQGYASSWDAERDAFGAELLVKAVDRRLEHIADYWVFHTHAQMVNDDTFEVKPDMGANHLKPADDARGRTSINFISRRAFENIARDDDDIQRSFRGWMKKRGGWEALLNQNKLASKPKKRHKRPPPPVAFGPHLPPGWWPA